jgi:hypothetical protein
MSFNKKFFTTGGIVASSGDAACSTDSVQAFGADNAFSSNIALYQLDGNDDDTTGNYNGTIDTGVTYSATGAKFGQAANFNGSSAIVLPNTILSSDCSISTWFNLNSSGTTDTLFEFDHENRILFRPQSGSYSAYIGNSGYFDHGLSFSTGQWYHLVITFSAGNPFKIYVDGVLSSYTSGNTSVYSLNHDNILGAANPSGGAGLNGKIDQVRIFDKAISAEDVATLYAETESTASNTNPLSEGAGVALYSLDYDASEASGYYDGTPTNVEFGVGGKINYGARFNATSSNINIGGNVVNSLTKLSVSMWVYWDGTTNSNDDYFIALGKASSGKIFSADITNSTGIIGFYDGASVLNSTGAVSANTWTHIVLTADATVLKMYLNGSLDSTHTISSLNFDSSGNAGFIGSWITGTDYEFDGSIDQVRLFSKALNSTEVSTLYAETACVYDSTTGDNYFPLADGSSDAVAYYKLDNSAEDSVGTNDGTEYNIEYRFGRFGQAAVFNGSNSGIFISSTGTSVTDYDQDFSISFWFNFISLNASYSYNVLFTGGGTKNIQFLIDTTNGARFQLYNGTIYYVDTGAVSAGNWYHVVATRSKTNGLEIYLNGISKDTNSFTGNSSAVNYKDSIGSYWDGTRNSFNGSIDQVRIFSSVLSASQITALYNEKPEVDTSNFKAVLYEGNGDTSNDTYISNVGIDLETNGGLVWVKARTNYNHLLMDSVRGTDSLTSNDTTTESANYNRFKSYEANGFMIRANNAADLYKINRTGNAYVSWVFKGGGEAVNIGVNTITGSTPSIASDVSANTDAGFSIVKYTGNSTSGATVGHGLSSTPEIIIVKNLDANSTNWIVKIPSVMPNDEDYLYLNETNEVQTAGSTTFIRTVNSSIFTLGGSSQTNSTDDFIAYCWHSVAGYSKIGTYEGNGNTDGPTIYTTDNGASDGSNGFEPSWLMIKQTSGTSQWLIVDNTRNPSNPVNARLRADKNNAESTSYNILNFLSNGFKIITADNDQNTDEETYLYMAFK